jgi:hypothetical protein
MRTGSIIPSGSVSNVNIPRWAVPSSTLDNVPTGTLVRILPIVGPLLSGLTGIVLSPTDVTIFSKNQMYKILSSKGIAVIPNFALEILSYPPEV